MFQFGMKMRLGQEHWFRISSVYCKYKFTDITKPVVISFAHQTGGMTEGQMTNGESPWGFSFLSSRAANVMSFSFAAGRYCYYRDRVFLDALPFIGEALEGFPARLGYGASVGGYAVSAFSSPLRIDRLLLLAPISSRRRDIATWDFEADRSLPTFDYDWSGNYSDGAETTASGYVVYDPFFRLDKLHAQRYIRLKRLVVPSAGHIVGDRLQALGMLTPLVDNFIANTIVESAFYTTQRGRRS